MDSDQLRVALILSVLAGLMLGFIGFVFAAGVRERIAPAIRTPIPTIVLSPTSTEISLLPSRRPATATLSPTQPPTVTPIPNDTPIPTATTGGSPTPAVTEIPSIETVEWVIVTGSYEVLQEALAASARFREAGYSVTLFLRDGVFRGAVVGYPTINAARDPLEEVRITLASDAYLRDLNVWCPERVQQSGYFTCE